MKLLDAFIQIMKLRWRMRQLIKENNKLKQELELSNAKVLQFARMYVKNLFSKKSNNSGNHTKD